MLVMVYGTLKKGFGNHRLLHGSKYAGPASVAGTMRNLGYFPVVTLGGSGTVYGEVYDVDEPTLKSLDSLEGYPGWYNREEVVTTYGIASIYTLDKPDAPVVEDGVWRKSCL